MTILAVLGACLFIGGVGVSGDSRRKNRDDRYWAMLADGTILTGREIKDWQDVRKQPRLGNRQLFEKNKTVMVIVDTSSQPHLIGPYVEFANGDVLTGRTVSGHPGDSDQGIIAHLMVSVRSPLYSWDIS